MAGERIQYTARDVAEPEFFDDARCRGASIWELARDFPLVGRWVDERVDRLRTDEQARAQLFFPGKGEWKTLHAAKSVCEACPVADECLEWALRNREAYGVFGGRSESQRKTLRAEMSLRTSPRHRGPIIHGTAWGQYRRCVAENGKACDRCRLWLSQSRPRSA